MPRLIIVAGASGSGKSFLLENAQGYDRTLVPIRKLTTRSPRPYEDSGVQQYLDLKFDTPAIAVHSCSYRYRYVNEWYGISREDIMSVLASGNNPIVIVGNCETIVEMKRDFPDSLVVYVQSALSGEDLKRVLQVQGRRDIDIHTRMDRIDKDFHDYVRHLRYNIFDYVLINTFDPDSLLEQLQVVLDQAIRERKPVDPGLVFVLMSFDKEMDDTYEALRVAGQIAGQGILRVERIDAIHGDYKITDRILQEIQRAALVICDLTRERPNVYYELGYARGLGKTVLHCAERNARLHFDIKDFRTLFYDSPMHLQRELVSEFRHVFSHLLAEVRS